MALRNRIRDFSNNEINDLIKKHIRYRVMLLKTYDNINSIESKIPINMFSHIKACSAEAARITCRQLIQFMGLGLNKDGNLCEKNFYHSHNGNSYEVKITDIGGEWVKKNSLTSDEKDLLEKTIKTGDRATAHLTHEHPYGGENKILERSIELVCKLLENNLYNIVQIPFPVIE